VKVNRKIQRKRSLRIQ